MVISLDGKIPFRYLAISDQSVCPEPVPRRIEQLLSIGVPAVQLRDKSETDRTRYEWLRSVDSSESGTLMVNGRADIAELGGADGIHLPSDGLESKDVRSVFSGNPIIGRSTHNPREVTRAEEEGIDYVTFGPVYPTESKPDLSREEIPGIQGLQKVCKLTQVPVFALGGVKTADRVKECLERGARGVAGIRALFEPDDPGPVWREIRDILRD
jgi:thiamine-phosphate pyrophosphorylase